MTFGYTRIISSILIRKTVDLPKAYHTYDFMLFGLDKDNKEVRLGFRQSIDVTFDHKNDIIAEIIQLGINSLTEECFEGGVKPNVNLAHKFYEKRLLDVYNNGNLGALSYSTAYNDEWMPLDTFIRNKDEETRLLKLAKNNHWFWENNKEKLHHHSYGLINVGSLHDDGSTDSARKFWLKYDKNNIFAASLEYVNSKFGNALRKLAGND